MRRPSLTQPRNRRPNSFTRELRQLPPMGSARLRGLVARATLPGPLFPRNSHHSLPCTLCSCSVKLFLSFPFADAGPPAWLAFRRPFPDQLHQPFKAQVCYLTGSYPVGNARPLGSSTSYLHLCGCAWFCTWFCLSFCKFPEDTGHTLSCKAQCLAVVCVQQKQSLSLKELSISPEIRLAQNHGTGHRTVGPRRRIQVSHIWRWI